MSLEYRVAFKALHDVLINEWDPIDVNDSPEAQNEYDSYIPVIFRLVSEGKSDRDIADHLAMIESDWMGLTPQPDRNLRIASRLREVVAWVKN